MLRTNEEIESTCVRRYLLTRLAYFVKHELSASVLFLMDFSTQQTQSSILAVEMIIKVCFLFLLFFFAKQIITPSLIIPPVNERKKDSNRHNKHPEFLELFFIRIKPRSYVFSINQHIFDLLLNIITLVLCEIVFVSFLNGIVVRIFKSCESFLLLVGQVVLSVHVIQTK
jgi:hypothetical protein